MGWIFAAHARESLALKPPPLISLIYCLTYVDLNCCRHPWTSTSWEILAFPDDLRQTAGSCRMNAAFRGEPP